jgi:hypothetical protein
MAHEPEHRQPTIAIYDRPPWWRTRKFWRIGLPVLAGIGSLAVWYAIFA